MHVAGADRADLHVVTLSSLREHDKYRPTTRCPADRAESPFRLGMIGVGQNDDATAKLALDLGDRNPVLLAFVLIGLIPVKAGKFHVFRSRLKIGLV